MLKLVTVTGADDKTDINDILDVASKYPFVEFGILLSPKSGKERYPSLSWIENLNSIKDKVNFSLHLCSDVLIKFVNGYDLNQIVDSNILSIFKRIQLNFYNNEINFSLFKKNIEKNSHINFIFQLKSFEDPVFSEANKIENIQYLYDCSGGNGILPSSWIESEIYCGYAGGLTSENLEYNLLEISKACKADFWIDAETGLRTNNQFDLNKVKKFLKIASNFT